MILTQGPLSAADFEAGTGWALQPQGACRGDVCVPLAADAVAGGVVDVDAVAGRLGMAVVTDETTGIRALGPDSVAGRALATAVAPDLVLPDLDGRAVALSSLRGQKVVLVSWAPY